MITNDLSDVEYSLLLAFLTKYGFSKITEQDIRVLRAVGVESFSHYYGGRIK